MSKSGKGHEPKLPEKKIGPFANGIGVAIWLNEVETDDGPKQFRFITIAPRRYQDKKTGEWKDSSGYQPSDLPALLFCLNKAQEYCYETPLPGQTPEASAIRNWMLVGVICAAVVPTTVPRARPCWALVVLRGRRARDSGRVA